MYDILTLFMIVMDGEESGECKSLNPKGVRVSVLFCNCMLLTCHIGKL